MRALSELSRLGREVGPAVDGLDDQEIAGGRIAEDEETGDVPGGRSGAGIPMAR